MGHFVPINHGPFSVWKHKKGDNAKKQTRWADSAAIGVTTSFNPGKDSTFFGKSHKSAKSLITSFELVWEIALTGKVKFLSIHCTLYVAGVNVKEQELTNGVWKCYIRV